MGQSAGAIGKSGLTAEERHLNKNIHRCFTRMDEYKLKLENFNHQNVTGTSFPYILRDNTEYSLSSPNSLSTMLETCGELLRLVFEDLF